LKCSPPDLSGFQIGAAAFWPTRSSHGGNASINAIPARQGGDIVNSMKSPRNSGRKRETSDAIFVTKEREQTIFPETQQRN
jgi:hypothetical protein